MENMASKRTLIRLYSFALALVIVLAVGGALAMQDAKYYKRQLEIGHLRSLGNLVSYTTEITNTLTKGIYSATPTQLSLLSASLWRDSAGAKQALSELPPFEEDIEGAYRFLSQVGDYAMSLSKKVQANPNLSKQEIANLEMLLVYSQQLNEYVYHIQEQVINGDMNLMNIEYSGHGRVDLQPQGNGALSAQPLSTTKDMPDALESVKSYATLIYDGPFSDHMLDRAPLMTRDMPHSTKEQAKAKAERIWQAADFTATVRTQNDPTTQKNTTQAGTQVYTLQVQEDENSLMPLYCFGTDTISIGMTKNGNIPAYYMNSREIGEKTIYPTNSVQVALQFLEEIGFKNMRSTYFEEANGICTINFAYKSDEVTYYTDLIKVGVALDNGEILFMDTRSYISNHHARIAPSNLLAETSAVQNAGTLVKVNSTSLAMIPTSGGNEILCYELNATGSRGHQLLIYINAVSGVEEQLLIQIQTPGGVLTV